MNLRPLRGPCKHKADEGNAGHVGQGVGIPLVVFGQTLEAHHPGERPLDYRTSKFAFVRTVESAGKMEAADFLRELIQAVPYRIHTVLTDNGVQFTARKQDIWDSEHIFDRVCNEQDIEHRLTKANHPWTNGRVERMNRTIKDATAKCFHYDTHDQFRAHLQLFVHAYKHARRPKTLHGLTPRSATSRPRRK